MAGIGCRDAGTRCPYLSTGMASPPKFNLNAISKVTSSNKAPLPGTMVYKLSDNLDFSLTISDKRFGYINLDETLQHILMPNLY